MKSSAKTDGTAAASATADDDANTTANGSAAKTTAKSTGKVTSAASGKTASGVTKTNTKATATTFDARLPAGGISMMTPAVASGAQYYKIGDWVTFAWNYTSLSITPTAIDILATCTKNQATYTLAVNQTVGSTGYVLWDTGAYQSTATVPLLTETYTLIVHDADSSISAAPKAGYLAVASTYTFGMYVPQSYTPWAGKYNLFLHMLLSKLTISDYHCPTCSSGSTLSATERQTLGFLFAMSTITVLSFTWFANGFGIF